MTGNFLKRKRDAGSAAQGDSKKEMRRKRHQLEGLFRNADVVNRKPQMTRREMRARIDRELALQRSRQNVAAAQAQEGSVQ